MPNDLQSVFIHGRLKEASRRQIAESLVKQAGKLVRDPHRATAIVVAHAGASTCVIGNRIELPFSTPKDAVLLSESAFKRRLGLVAGIAPHSGGPYQLDDVARLSGLSPDACHALVLFDVIAVADGGHGYQDLATAKQAARLLAQGISLLSIIKAALELGARGMRVSQVRLAEAPWGKVVQVLGERIAQLDGQFALVLDEEIQSADASFANGIASEAEGDLAEAERWYRRAEQLDRTDPVVEFNLGNVLISQNRSAEAAIAFRRALERDSSFAEAGFNLAGLYEGAGQSDRAVETYRETIAAHPTYSQALYNCARLLTKLGRFAEALPLWQRFIDLVPTDPDIGHARRSALLCRLENRRPDTLV